MTHTNSPPPQLSEFKKPLNIFEAIEKKDLPQSPAPASPSDPSDEGKKAKETYRSEFLFPIRMLF